MNREKESDRIIKVVGYSILIGFAITCICLLFVRNPQGLSDSIAISFFGILATFVVIGNYSQVSHLVDENKRIQKQTDERMIELATKHKEEVDCLYKEINKLKGITMNDDESSKLESSIKFVEEFKNNFDKIQKGLLMQYQKNVEEINSKEFTNVIDSVIYLVHGEHNEFVLNLVSKREVECNVKRHDSEDIENVVAKWEHEHLVFYNNEEELIDDVEILNGIEFCGEQINKVLRVLMKSSLSDGTEREDSTSIASIFEI